MAITEVKIHPAIGVARVGNSPDDFFIGPERLWDASAPQGGFKDSECRVKRQACRFRVFAYHDDGTVEELSDETAEIEWGVHLVNKKAITRNSGTSADLTIDPGERTLTAPNQRAEFDDGTITLPGASAVTVPLGEVRTDDAGRLLVLGGFGTSASPTNQTIFNFYDNPGWYDDVSDGPVRAHVRIRDGGAEFDAAGAWVIVAPPKFAPQLENVITLYDRIYQLGVDQGWLTTPTNPSYTHDIYPVLERARTTRYVEDVFGAHAWPDPVYAPATRQAIFSRLALPGGGGGNMPLLNDATLTGTQYTVMTLWKDGTFVQDWSGPPAPDAQITPQGLDRAALTSCVGAAFYPGIEAGGIAAVPILEAANYVGASDPMRLSHSNLAPGDLTQHMALPWQADFFACGDNWWPVPRPNDVIPEGGGPSVRWDRDVASYEEMVGEWHTLGFVVRQGDEYVEVDRCDTTFIALMTPQLDFQQIPQGPVGTSRKTALAVAFEVRSAGSPVTLEVLPGDEPSHPRITLDATQETVGPTAGNAIATARLWVVYETGTVGELLNDEVTVTHAASGRSWTIPISASTAARRTAAAALVLDRSGSMNDDRGDGISKHQSLKEAAGIFVDVMLEGDGVGIVRYNQDAQQLQQVAPLGDPGDPFGARQDTKDVINGPDLAPGGATSIGDGIYEGRQILAGATSSYDVKALVVLTDGNENRARWIADVSAEIDERTYAVGLGRPDNTSAPALQTISGNNGGYLLVTGPISGDNRFILQKYFLQILAGISNADIVLDPSGALTPEREHRIPFQLTEADSAIDVILLTDHPRAVDFRIQTPNGFILEPWRALADTAMTWKLSDGVVYYRFPLPVELEHARYDHGGTWHALLRIGKPRTERPDGQRPPLAGEHLATHVPANLTDRLAWRARPEAIGRHSEGVEIARRIPPRTGRDPLSVVDMTGTAENVVAGRAAGTGGTLPYSLLVHTYSNLTLRVSSHQSGYSPGASVTVTAKLAESGVPVRGASVWAEVSEPDGGAMTVALDEDGTGTFRGSFVAAEPGVFRCRVRSSGRSRRGYPFQREQTVTAAVWSGGDRDAEAAHERPRADGGAQWICSLLRCLMAGGVDLGDVTRRLRGLGIDVDSIRSCLEEHCLEADGHRDG